MLLESVEKKTFSVGISTSIDSKSIDSEPSRVKRDNYYRILSLDVSSDNEDSRREMRKTYMIRKTENDRNLLKEDIDVEDFWKQRLQQLPSDQ